MARTSHSGPTFLGLFSGCGGFDLGFEFAGYRSLGGFDNNPVAVDCYMSNLSGTANLVDLATVNRLPRALKPEVVIAGPPCQGFSTLGSRNSSDPRNRLLTHAAILAVSLRPKVIVIENVAGAMSGALAKHWQEAEFILRSARYTTRSLVLQAEDLGLPQIRKRAILIGSKQANPLGLVLKPSVKTTYELMSLLEPGPGVPNHQPVLLDKGTRDYAIARKIGQHQKLCNVRRSVRSVPTWEIPEVFGEVTSEEKAVLSNLQALRRQCRQRDFGDADPVDLRRIEQALGGKAKAILSRLVRKGYVRHLDGRYDLTNSFNGKYRRLSWSHPAPAVDTRFGQPRYILHPTEHRGLSVREAARIQGFPDSFLFNAPIREQYRLVGNAVPPPFGK